jgi:predicted dehydrogenase
MIKIGLIGTQSMHALSFAQVCNIPDAEGNFCIPGVSVTAAFGVDDTPEHLQMTLEKGSIPVSVSSLEEMFDHCNACMILQRNGGEHLKYAAEIIKRGYPVFIDKPVCCSVEDIQALQTLAETNNAIICGGSGLKYAKQIAVLKKKLEDGTFGQIKGATINHSADIESPYGGIFFYLPHAVEMMLELFGYDPVSVNTTVLSHNNFTVCVKYKDFIVNLAINGSAPAYVVVNGRKTSDMIKVDDSDIFVESMKRFVVAIENKQMMRDAYKLTRHVAVILAVKEAIETNQEVMIGK